MEQSRRRGSEISSRFDRRGGDSGDMSQLGDRRREQLTNAGMRNVPNKLKTVLSSPFTVAVVTGVIAAIMLIIVKPPFVQQCKEDPVQKCKVSYSAVLVWSLIAAALAFAIPKLTSRLCGEGGEN